MFRTVVIEKEKELRVSNGILHVTDENEDVPIPLKDIYCIVLDNLMSVCSVASLVELTAEGAHLVLCDRRHMPTAVLYPEVIHYRPYHVVKMQLETSIGLRNALWDSIVKSKLINQAEVLSFCTGNNDVSERIRELADEVEEGDGGNREGIGAKMFFRNMYGSEFVRMKDDGINSALNYGYAILRSCIVKTLYTFGYYPPIGIHHIGVGNPFNLGDDLIEPFRPLVDAWVSIHNDDLLTELTGEQRLSLISLVNMNIEYEGKNMKLRNVINLYIKSFTTALQEKDLSKFTPPVFNKKLYDSLCHVI